MASTRASNRKAGSSAAILGKGAPPGSSVERLVETAAAMFNRFGIHATGIDRILAASGVARMTLYNRFGSKEGLIREVLLRESRAWFDRLDRALADAGPIPRDRIAIYFKVLEAWFAEPDFKGCGFINAVGESSLEDECARPIAKAHRDANVAYVRALLGDTVADPDALADTIVMIANGATVDVMVTGDPTIVARASRTALRLIEPERQTPSVV